MLNGNLETQVIQLVLYGSWQGNVTAYKSGNIVMVHIDTVSNTANGQILAHIPNDLKPKSVIAGVAFDATDKTTVNRISLAQNQLAICNFDFSNWYTAGHVYTGTITYVL